jgi:hypothetical protein
MRLAPHRRSGHGLPAAVVALALLAGCGGGEKTVPPSQLSKLVLQAADLHGPYTAFDVGRQTQLDLVPGPRSDPQRFGREGGWKARYHRPGSATTRGPLVVESRADVFKDAAGATKDLAAYRAQFARQPAARRLKVAPVGAETAAVLQQGAGTRFISVAWRDGNVTASVTVNGFAAGLRQADAVALARAQERRIAAALR